MQDAAAPAEPKAGATQRLATVAEPSIVSESDSNQPEAEPGDSFAPNSPQDSEGEDDSRLVGQLLLGVEVPGPKAKAAGAGAGAQTSAASTMGAMGTAGAIGSVGAGAASTQVTELEQRAPAAGKAAEQPPTQPISRCMSVADSEQPEPEIGEQSDISASAGLANVPKKDPRTQKSMFLGNVPRRRICRKNHVWHRSEKEDLQNGFGHLSVKDL